MKLYDCHLRIIDDSGVQKKVRVSRHAAQRFRNRYSRYKRIPPHTLSDDDLCEAFSKEWLEASRMCKKIIYPKTVHKYAYKSILFNNDVFQFVVCNNVLVTVTIHNEKFVKFN